MHIPDGLLSAPVWLGLDALAAPAVGYFARRAQRETGQVRVPLLGVMGAFVFAAQMINFPVGPGTSGHLVGGALLAIALGPSAAVVVLTSILAVQAFVFQDGGILALGANITNMAVAGVLAAWLPYRAWGGGRRRAAAIFAAGALSVAVSAALAIAELMFSGIRVPAAALWASVALFGATAGLEGAITVAVVRGIERVGPRLLREPEPARRPGLAVIGMTALLLATVGVLFASAHPDGVASLAARAGIASAARSIFQAPLADYQARWLQSAWMQKASAGLAGLAAVYAVCLLLGRYFERQRSA